ncbi:menaquinone-specific isochorismate synthase [Vibrio ponticus]|nr:menaquinone-specific isochorismate synthase [Vibrio ponticus]
MSYFQQAITELIERVKDAKDEVTRLVQVLEYKPDFAFIDWLQAQPLFPKFYWQSRDTREEVVALGQLRTFDNPAPAYAYLSGEQRIWVVNHSMVKVLKILIALRRSSFYRKLSWFVKTKLGFWLSILSRALNLES